MRRSTVHLRGRPRPPTGVISHRFQTLPSREAELAGLGRLDTGLGGPLSPCPRAPDCFFQLGNLIFAEADYQQALELNPQDEGANLRMGLLQEMMGFCQQKSKCAGAGGGPGLGAGPGGGGAAVKPPAGIPGF